MTLSPSTTKIMLPYILAYLALSILATAVFCRLMAVLPKDD